MFRKLYQKQIIMQDCKTWIITGIKNTSIVKLLELAHVLLSFY